MEKSKNRSIKDKMISIKEKSNNIKAILTRMYNSDYADLINWDEIEKLFDEDTLDLLDFYKKLRNKIH